MPVRSKPAKEAGTAANVLKSLGQTAFLWAVFLFAIPAAIRWVEDRTILHTLRFDPGWWRHLATFVFVLFALLGFWSGWTLVKLGRGTPFPLACTHRFVVAGPYRYIRNPMVVFGIGQGISVGIYLGSWLTIGYALLGALAWNTLARPWEEHDLAQRFGEPYENYRRSVPCWRVRLRPYTD